MSADVLDVYDSDVEKILGVLARLQDRARHRRHNYNDFDREIREAFAEIGFTVAVNWHEFEMAGQKQEGAMPEVTVTGRTDPGFVFDPEQQVHEAVSNVLGLPGEDGWIKTDPDTLRNFMEGNGGGHAHGHGHHH
jgi:hypothetical protein